MGYPWGVSRALCIWILQDLVNMENDGMDNGLYVLDACLDLCSVHKHVTSLKEP